MLREFFYRIVALFKQSRMDRELEEEMRFHLERQVEEHMKKGMGPEEAKHAALREFGNQALVKEQTRINRGFNTVESLWQDLRFGARSLRKNPGFTFVAVFTLALGIGANTAIFSVVNAVLLRPLPYANPDRLVSVQDSMPGIGFPKAGLSEVEYLRLRRESQAFEQVAFYVVETFTLTGGAGELERISAGLVSSDFFTLLGIRSAAGRTFNSEEELEGRNNVVILSAALRKRLFPAESDVTDKALTLNGRKYTVVGVLPADFKSPFDLQSDARLDLWVPFGINQASPRNGNHSLNTIGRLRPGVRVEQARAETNAIIGRVVQEQPGFYPADGSFQVLLAPIHDELVGDVRPALLVLLGAVGFVLLIACANVANLLLVRGDARRKEIAIRAALGASRTRIIRQLLVESTLLSFTGGGLGILLAYWSIDLLLAFGPEGIPRLREINIDGRVLGFTLLLSLLTGVVFGLVPARGAVKTDLKSSLKEGGRTSSPGLAGGRLRDVLVVVEISLSLVLLVGAGLLTKSFISLQRVNTGFDREHLLTMRLFPPASIYPENRQVTALYDRLLARLQSLPGVRSAAAASDLPMSGSNMDTMMEIQGRPFDVSFQNLSTDIRIVSPDYFRAMGVRLVRGRTLTDTDREATTPVAVISETLARTHWPNEDALGRRLRLLDAPPAQATTPYLQIVGVVADVKNRNLSNEARQEVYVPLSQHAASFGRMGLVRRMTLVIRTATADPLYLAQMVRGEILRLDRNIPVTEVRTMDQIMEVAVVQPRFNMILLGLFAGIALGLGSIGIYGVMSYTVARRTHEFGIRMALGARRADVLKLVIGRGLLLAFLGVVTGLGASLAVTRTLKSMLYGVSAIDPITFALVALLLVAVALLSCYLPARRATRVDPLLSLRYE